jgi:hypothetical protein
MKTTTFVKLIGLSMILEMSALLNGCATSLQPVPAPTPSPTPVASVPAPMPPPITIIPAPLPGITANPTPTSPITVVVKFKKKNQQKLLEQIALFADQLRVAK